MLLHGCLVVVVFVSVVGSSLGQIVQQESTIRNGYTALVPVNIRCVNDKIRGLTCNAEYPTQCKEQWNFPNPCTLNNLSQNKTRFVHPLDKTKFLMCDDLGKLYVVQCPQYEAFDETCGQCVGEGAGFTASCERPLIVTQRVANPCSREAIIANKLFFGFPGNLTKFIHCDIWGKAWERICTPGEVWSQFDVACVNPVRLNPCNRRVVTANALFTHPCNPYKYLQCGANGEALESMCQTNTAFSEANQRCDSIGTFTGILENICGNFNFGFRLYTGPARTAQIDITRTSFQNQGGVANPPVFGQGSMGSINSASTLSQRNTLTTGLRVPGQGSRANTARLRINAEGGQQTGIDAIVQGLGLNSQGAQQVDTNGIGQGMGVNVQGAQQASANVITKRVGFNLPGAQQAGANAITQGIGMNMNVGVQGGAAQQSIDNKVGLAIGGKQDRLSEILNVWRQNVAGSSGGGVSRLNDGNVNLRGGFMEGVARLNKAAAGNGKLQMGTAIDSAKPPKKGIMSVESVHPSQLKEYAYSELAYSDPCTVDNLSNGRTHFRMLGDPHSFLQCDNAGRMYRMPCSTNKRDWFDVYTMTCVDGPIHVDDKVLRGL